MDLGALLGQLGTAYIQNKYAPQPTSFIDDIGVPFVDVIPEAPTSNCEQDMVYKKVCGEWKWVKRRKRRRKRLATHSDIKDLSALKGVLGQGKLLETWIATHG